MYMSYCRFEGTEAELRACLADVEEHIDGEPCGAISHREISCFRSIITTIYDFMDRYEIIDQNGELDEDALEVICKAMAQEGEEYDR